MWILLASAVLAGALGCGGSDPACPDPDNASCGGDGDGAEPDSGTAPDAAPLDSSPADADQGEADAAPSGAASLRVTEINPASQTDLVELVAVRGGSLDGITVEELTNSNYLFAFPAGYAVAAGDVLVLHLAGECTDEPGDPASCGDATPFTTAAWDFGMPGSLSYSGKVLVVRADDGTAVDAVPFVESSGTPPATYVAAVQQIQSAGMWDATPCIDDPSTGLARDRFCRNISVLWDNLDSDNSNSVIRLGGDSPLDVPGSAEQWSAALPATWGTHPAP
jgi:hypothetical protein